MLDRIQSNILKKLFWYWDEKRGQRAAPSRNDIDPAQMVAFLPILFLLDVEDEPRRYRVRLMGTELVRWAGEDLTDRHVDQITSHVPAALDQLVMIWEPWLVTGKYENKTGRLRHYQLLALTLSSDGATVNMIFGGVAQFPQDYSRC